MNEIIDRIEHQAGVPGLVSILSEQLAPTDLQSLLLEVYRVRADHRTPSEVLREYETDRFVQPSPVSPRSLSAWERIAYHHLPESFTPLALSPLCPLGTNSVVAPVTQNWAVSTSRNTEVVSDSSNVLALECALCRRELLRSNPKAVDPVHLAASHRLVRAQKFDGPRSFAHFASFVLCSAGRALGSYEFEISALELHLRFYLKALRAYLGQEVPLIVTLTDFEGRLPETFLAEEFRSRIEGVTGAVVYRVDHRRSRAKGYYTNFAFLIHVESQSGEEMEILDGGTVDWTQKHLSNAKERLVISGLGTERLCLDFPFVDDTD